MRQSLLTIVLCLVCTDAMSLCSCPGRLTRRLQGVTSSGALNHVLKIESSGVIAAHWCPDEVTTQLQDAWDVWEDGTESTGGQCQELCKATPNTPPPPCDFEQLEEIYTVRADVAFAWHCFFNDEPVFLVEGDRGDSYYLVYGRIGDKEELVAHFPLNDRMGRYKEYRAQNWDRG